MKNCGLGQLPHRVGPHRDDVAHELSGVRISPIAPVLNLDSYIETQEAPVLSQTREPAWIPSFVPRRSRKASRADSCEKSSIKAPQGSLNCFPAIQTTAQTCAPRGTILVTGVGVAEKALARFAVREFGAIKARVTTSAQNKSGPNKKKIRSLQKLVTRDFLEMSTHHMRQFLFRTNTTRKTRDVHQGMAKG
ncbi:hypothetical protein [Paraburkholderia sp. BL17N1]|uniref:hypothetical protein n=1 Tax=Paraburkholderia sp. BL17N1 TaxID=1938798 RepID=UPI0011C3442F|nr:hypothetical protein [Paraburkholderia sp. BL17N1]